MDRKGKKLAKELLAFIEESDWSDNSDRKYQSITKLKKENLALYKFILAIDRENWIGLQENLEEFKDSLEGGEEILCRAISKVVNLSEKEREQNSSQSEGEDP